MDDFGISPSIAARLRQIFERAPNIERVWIYGSRARGTHRDNSDIDLAIDAPNMERQAYTQLWAAIQDAGLIYQVDTVHWQTASAPDFRARIERDRKIFWQPRRHAVQDELGSTQLKPFQTNVLARLDDYLAELKKHRAQSEAAMNALRVMEGMEDAMRELSDFPKKTWGALKAAGKLPPAFAGQPHSSRFDGTGKAIPNVCLKVPTGGGKTLLAAASVGRVFSGYLNQDTGLVLWIVPNEAIYRQTLKTLGNRDHPYRQMLNLAGAGRVKILEKDAPITRLDVESHLCVMLLMLQSAARKDEAQKKLKAFRDRGNVLGFTPREDDYDGHWEMLQTTPNLDVYGAFGQDQQAARKQKGSIIKSSLGNVLRLKRPMVVIDEGHHAYTENALRTLDGFNPCFMLELSATPRISSPSPASGRGVGVRETSGSNILVDVRGTDLDDAEMIKLPIHVDVRGWPDWQSCLASSVAQLDALQQEATQLQAETSRYIRPILLVQVERTGKELRDAGFIHAEDAKAYLMQLGFAEAQIAIKTADKDELKQPENIDLLSPTCEIRAIITKQALQEGWDCPFAYVLCALAAGRAVGAMTQLTGRILRQPHVLKTGKPALDSCYVLCHDAQTGEVIKAIKHSLETEGMGDLALSVTGGNDAETPKPVAFKRRAGFEKLRIFLPRVTWVESELPSPASGRGIEGEGAVRRELCYESDIISNLDWSQLNPDALLADWAPGVSGIQAQRFDITLEVLQREDGFAAQAVTSLAQKLDRARLVRGLLDIAPNAWWVWGWVDAVVKRLLQGCSETQLAAASASLLERLRVDVEAERDRLAMEVFTAGVASGRIEFALRTDSLDYEIPEGFTLPLAGEPQTLTRKDGHAVEKSLFQPALTALTDSGLERDFACYLDGQAALQWWHRNVARTQYGLQGWKRNKVYPDFVFARLDGAGRSRMVVMETKGLHLAGSDDTAYKRGLLQQLSTAFRDARFTRAGTLALEGGESMIECDLMVDQAWQGDLEARHFST
jgi:type III restriction enzyme